MSFSREFAGRACHSADGTEHEPKMTARETLDILLPAVDAPILIKNTGDIDSASRARAQSLNGASRLPDIAAVDYFRCLPSEADCL